MKFTVRFIVGAEKAALKTSSPEPQNWWFIDVLPFAQGYFQVPAVSFQGCSIFHMGKYIYGHGFYHGKKGTRIKA